MSTGSLPTAKQSKLPQVTFLGYGFSLSELSLPTYISLFTTQGHVLTEKSLARDGFLSHTYISRSPSASQ